MRRAVLLASTLPSLQGGGVLLIDEIETGIHVSALGRVFAWLTNAARDLGVQVVATTHSLEAVDAMAVSSRNGLPDLVTFHLDQTEHETKTKRINEDLLVRIRREARIGCEVSQSCRSTATLLWRALTTPSSCTDS